MAAKYKKTVIPISGGKIALYASPKVSAAVASVTKDMNLFRGVKFAQIIEAVYEQGK
jgi:hypothetical protein